MSDAAQLVRENYALGSLIDTYRAALTRCGTLECTEEGLFYSQCTWKTNPCNIETIGVILDAEKRNGLFGEAIVRFVKYAYEMDTEEDTYSVIRALLRYDAQLVRYYKLLRNLTTSMYTRLLADEVVLSPARGFADNFGRRSIEHLAYLIHAGIDVLGVVDYKKISADDNEALELLALNARHCRHSAAKIPSVLMRTRVVEEALLASRGSVFGTLDKERCWELIREGRLYDVLPPLSAFGRLQRELADDPLQFKRYAYDATNIFAPERDEGTAFEVTKKLMLRMLATPMFFLQSWSRMLMKEGRPEDDVATAMPISLETQGRYAQVGAELCALTNLARFARSPADFAVWTGRQCLEEWNVKTSIGTPLRALRHTEEECVHLMIEAALNYTNRLFFVKLALLRAFGEAASMMLDIFSQLLTDLPERSLYHLVLKPWCVKLLLHDLTKNDKKRKRL